MTIVYSETNSVMAMATEPAGTSTLTNAQSGASQFHVLMETLVKEVTVNLRAQMNVSLIRDNVLVADILSAETLT